MRSPRLAPLSQALLLGGIMLAGACGGVFGQRAAEGDWADDDTRVSRVALVELNITNLGRGPAGLHRLQDLDDAIQRGRDSEQVRLKQVRARLLSDLVISAWSLRDRSPEISEWAVESAFILSDWTPFDPESTAGLLQMVEEGLSNANERRDALHALRFILENGALSADMEGERVEITRAFAMLQGVGAWLHYGDFSDGGTFSERVHLLRPASMELPEPDLGDELALEVNLRAAQALGTLVQQLQRVQNLQTPLARHLRPTLQDLRESVAAAYVPLALPPELIQGDVRITPPPSFLEPPFEHHLGLGFSFRRILFVRADSITGLVVPHIHWRNGAVQLSDPGLWRYPGQELLRFEGLGAIAPDDLENAEIPALLQALQALEEALANRLPLPPGEEAVDGASAGLSLIVDGDTWFGTLEPLLNTLNTADYAPIAIHTFHEDTATLDAVAVRLEYSAAEGDNLLIVREDGYLFQRWVPGDLSAPRAVSRTDDAPLVALHRALQEGYSEGLLDPERPLTVRVDDKSTDFGILTHLLMALTFERDLEGVERDRDLLRAPIVRTGEGLPRILFPGGLRLIL